MKVIEYSKKHYEEVCKWWTVRNWMIIPENVLPKTGVIIATKDGVNICAGWLYRTDSNLCAIEWVISNPESAREQRDEAQDLLFKSLLDRLEVGEMVLGFSEFEAMTERYEKHGFIRSGKHELLVRV